MPSHHDFSFVDALGSQNGDQSDAVGAVQQYLQRFGYMREETIGTFSTSSFDEGTSQALRLYQSFHGLPVTGAADEATVTEMSKPRCGFPDFPGVADYQLEGRKWDRTDLTYRIVNLTPDLNDAEVRAAMRFALDLWENASALTFREVAGQADIEISFVSGDHGDGSSFDGPGQVLAHAFYPPPNGGAIAGDAHFDEGESWSVAIPVPAGAIDLHSVAAHEFGHSIGLAHSRVRGALMFPTYSGPQRFLHQDDVEGVRALYGA
jgi:hypothetical protein